MSATIEAQVPGLIAWINDNGFWREDLVVQLLRLGGLGVFGQFEDGDPLVLRIPKLNVLSAKTLGIYNLLYDYVPKADEIDFKLGMYPLIVAVIYEHLAGSKLPWAGYLASIDFANSDVPICLWSDADKANLANTEVDLMGVLNPEELLLFFDEARRFAAEVKQHVPIPKVLEGMDQIVEFSRYVQGVVSRAFVVDDHLGLALVPGADLFNHLSPVIVDGKRQARENVHFVCDNDVCDVCGERECNHDDVADDDDEEMDVDQLMEELREEVDDSNDDDDDGNVDDDDEDNEDGDDDDNDEGHGDNDDEDDDDDSDDIDDDDDDSIDEHGEDLGEMEGEMVEEEEEPITEITEEVIKALENELVEDDDTDCDDDEALTIDQVQISSHDYDLARELSDDSKCCDLVLVSLPSADHEFEVFNTYGNDLNNAYLLQRYGFVCPGNANDGISLGVPLMKSVKLKRVEARMEWLDDVFEVVCELVHQQSHEKDDDHEHENGDCCEDGNGECGEEEQSEGCGDDHSQPDLWQVSARIGADGKVTPHTYIILQLIGLPEKIFKYKLSKVQKARVLAQRIAKYLMTDDVAQYDAVIRKWCQQRLAAYPELQPSDHCQVIGELVAGEKAILKRFIGE